MAELSPAEPPTGKGMVAITELVAVAITNSTGPVVEIAAILRAQGRDPQITKEFVDALLLTEKDEKQAFTILALLRPDLDFRNAFHLDHLHPRASFSRTKLRAAGIPAEQMPFYQDGRNWNSIKNLGLLDPNENQSKGDITLEDWVDNEASRRAVSRGTICADLRLPQANGLLKLDKFPEFISERYRLLGDRLRELLAA
jgi:hypothetical protein